MQKGYSNPNDLDQLFSATESENPLNAQVAEKLSGTAQHLKSSNDAAAYKNYEGSNIEDHTLLGDANTKNVQADWTDTHAPGVTSEVTETAPQTSQNVALTDSHTSAYNTLNETIQTAQDKRSNNTTEWDQIIGTSQTTIPTKLDTTITGNGSNTVGNLKSQIDNHNFNTGVYNHNFGEFTTNGNMSMGGMGSFNGKTILIGPGGGNPTNLDFSLARRLGEYFPTVTGQIFGKSLPLGVFKTAGFLVTGQLDLEIDVNAQNKISVNPVGFDQKGMSIDLCETVNYYYSEFDISSADGLASLPNQTPTIGLTFNYGKMKFQNGVEARFEGGCYIFRYNTTTDNNAKDCRDWELHMITQAALTIKCYPMPLAGVSSGSSSIMAKAAQDLEQAEQLLKQWSAKIMDNPILTAEASYEQTQINQGDMPMEDSSDISSADAGAGLLALGSLIRVAGQPLALRVIGLTFEALEWAR